MRTRLDCYPCFLRQTIQAARMAGADEAAQQRIIGQVLELLHDVPLAPSPPEIGVEMHRLVRRETGCEDPYRALKQLCTQQALNLYPELLQRAQAAVDPLGLALRLAIAGNLIDYGMGNAADPIADLRAGIERALAQPLTVDHSPDLRAALAGARRVLYLGDNAGETVFDRILIETLCRPTVYVAKGGPALNDATVEDAREAGLDRVAQVVGSGVDAVGTILSICSPELRSAWEAADLIIAKGQGNYETLSERSGPVYYLLQVKCEGVANDIRLPLGSQVILRGDARPTGARQDEERKP